MRSITLVLSCLLAIGASGQQSFDDALKLINSEQYEEAEKVFAGLLENDPTNGDLYYYFGEALIRDYFSDTLTNSLEEFVSQAEELFQQGLQQDPSNALNLIGMGAVVLMRTSDTTQAQTYFDKAEATIPTRARQITPEHAVLLIKMGQAQLFSAVINYPRATYYLERAEEIDPENPYIYLTLGDLYITKNDASNALRNYNRAAYFDPTWPVPKIKIGDIYMRIPNLNQARPLFEEARDIDPNFAPVYRSLGELYYKSGYYDLSRENFEKFIELSGDNTPAKLRYANSLYKAGDYEGALTVYEDILQVDKSRNYIYRVAAYCCYDVRPQQLEKGKQYMETFLQNENPENVMWRDYAYYGRTLFRMANFSDSALLANSLTQFMKAYEMDSSNLSLVNELATNFYNAHWYEGAIRMLQRKAELNEGEENTDDIMRIARSYYSLKMFPEAEAEFKKYIERSPDTIDGYIFLARTKSLMETDNNRGLAVPDFQTVLDKFESQKEKYKNEVHEAYRYMNYYNLQRKNYTAVRSWSDKIYNLDETNNEWKMDALKSKAISYQYVEDWINARSFWQQYLQLNPPDAAAVRETVDLLTKTINTQRNMAQ